MYQALLDSGVSQNNVVQLSGHKSLKILVSYAVASREQQRQMSKILSGKENNAKPKSKPNAPKEDDHQAQLSSSNVQGSIPASNLSSGASIGSLTCRILFCPKPPAIQLLAFQLRRNVAAMLSSRQTRRISKSLA